MPGGYRWWEVAAGASSSVATHALIAAAADPGASAAEAERIDSAYFPPVGALTVLLDDLVDREADARQGEHNYTAYYDNGEEAAERLGAIVAEAAALIAGLPSARRHAAILDGVLGFYLGDAAARTPFALPIRSRLLASRATRVGAIAAIVSLRQRRKRPGGELTSGPSALWAETPREERGRP